MENTTKTNKAFNYKELNTLEKVFESLSIPQDAINDLSKVPDEFKEPLLGIYHLMVAHKAINKDFQPDYKNNKQKKWYSWFDLSSGGVRFRDSCYGYTHANSGFGPRLSSESEEQEIFIAQNFLKDFERFLK